MKINLNREKLVGLYELVQYLLAEFPANDLAEQLVDTLMDKVRIKLRNKLDHTRDSYSITLTKEEALAYFIWMQQLAPMIPKGHYVFEQNVSLNITNQIDRTYGTINGAGTKTAIALH